MLLADSSLQKINLGFPQQQSGICFHVRSNGISEGRIDFIQIFRENNSWPHTSVMPEYPSTSALKGREASVLVSGLCLRSGDKRHPGPEPESSEVQPYRDVAGHILTSLWGLSVFWHMALILGLQGRNWTSASLPPARQVLYFIRMGEARFTSGNIHQRGIFLEVDKQF